MSSLPIVAEAVRSGFVESVHHGSVVVLAADGQVEWSLGVVDRPILPRSSNKPLQAVALLRAGLAEVESLDDELLAVATASHSGEPYHVALVERLLAAGGLDATALDNTPALPYSESAAHALLRTGGGPDRLHQNCSGKHAAMVVTAARRGWPLHGYRDPQHPLQQAVAEGVEALAGEPITAVAVDGCGAPQHALTLVGVARAFGRLAAAAPGSPEHRVAAAMRAHPRAVGGTGRAVTALLESVPGLVVKDGAEGVYGAGLADGRAVALKIADGAARAATPVLVAALRRMGVSEHALAAVPALPVLGAGQPVGEVRATLPA